MKAKDLMISDYISVKPSEMPIKVAAVHHKKVAYHAVVNKLEWVRESLLKPIPLTSEFLEKNGFKKVLDEDGTECYRYYNRAADGYIKISLYNGSDDDWSIEIVNYAKFDDNEIVYNNNFIFLKVHQLQQALRLCGITCEIII